MSRAVTIQSNFTTGEIDPLLKSRIDINQYYNALETARNVLIQPQGGIERRPGLQFLFEIPSAANPQNGMKLVPFEFSTTQSYMLLFVHNRMYIFKNKELGITEYEKPRTITLSGNSTVRLKWGLSKGSSPKIVDLRYNLKALVTSL